MHSLRIGLIFIALAALPLPATAQSTWTGASSPSWSDPGNWMGGVPTAGVTATFNGPSANTAVSLGGLAQPVGTIAFDTASAAAYTFSGNAGDAFVFDVAGGVSASSTVAATQTFNSAIQNLGALIITNNTTGTAAPLLFNGPFSLASGGSADLLTVANTGPVTISGSFGTNFTAVSKTGAGALTLSGTNTAFTGNITVAAGTVLVGANDALGSGGTIQMNGGTLTLQGVTTNVGKTLLFNNAGALNNNGTSGTWSGPVVMQGTAGITISIVNNSNSSVTFNGNITAGSPDYTGQLLMRGNNTVGGMTTEITNGTITLPNATVSKTDNGAWIINSTGNSWAKTTLAVGTITLGATNALPTNLALTVGQTTSSTLLNLNGFDQTIGNVVVNGTANDRFTNLNNTTLSHLTINNTAADTYNQSIAGNLALIKSGPGTLTLSTPATLTNYVVTYTGGTTVTGGTLLVNNTTSVPTGTGTGLVNAIGSGTLGSGGTLGGTGKITGTITISSTTAGSQGGIVYPGLGGAAAGTLNVASMVWDPLGRNVFAYSPTSTTIGGGVNNLINGTGTLDLSNLSSTSPFDLNLQPFAASGAGAPLSYTIASFAGGITGTVGGVPTQPIANGTDVSSLFTLSGSFLAAPAPYAMVVAGVGGGSAQAIQLTFSPGPSQFTWTGATSGSWSGATTNWSPATIPTNSASDQLTFGATPNPAMTNDISGGLTLNSMTFNSSSPVYTLGGNTLTFATSGSGVLPSIVSNSANSVTLSVGVTLTNNLTVSGTGNVTLGGAIGGAGSVNMSGSGILTLSNTGNAYTGGTNVLSGTVQAAADGSLGSGNVTGATLGTLSFTGSTATTKSFAMNGGTIAVAAGQTVTFNGNQITGATLDGNGTFATNGVVFDNGVTTSSVSITSNSASDQFIHVVNNAALTFAAGLNPSVSTAISNLNGFTNEGSGSVTIGAGSAINAANFQSYGTLTVLPNTTAAPTVFTNTGTAPLGFNGGSRTFIGTPGTADPTGQNIVAYVDLHGQNAIVTDGLFVNNGGVFDTSMAGTATIIADFGSLVKGAGFYQNTVKTQNGGKFQTGNSPGSATFGNFVFGPGGVNNYVFAIDNATGTAGPSPGPSGLVSGWGLIKAVQVSLGAATTSGNFTWTATPSNPLTVAIDTLVNPTMVGTDVTGPMANFDPNQSYSWPAARWAGGYAGPTDVATLDADTSFVTSGLANPIAGTFGWSLDPADQSLSLVYTPNAVPEPGTLALVGLVAAGLAGWRRRGQAASRSHSGPA